jgi:hypothetical protein
MRPDRVGDVRRRCLHVGIRSGGKFPVATIGSASRICPGVQQIGFEAAKKFHAPSHIGTA